jgi:hypothetical protein
VSILVFPDTTVVRNFALLRRMDLLGDLVAGRAAWCATVAAECRAQARGDGLQDMEMAPAIFGSPWFPHDAEHIDITVLREELASPGDGPRQHFGEAETIVLASTRSPGAIFVTDDRSAASVATARGLQAVKTADLLRIAIRTRRLEPDAGWGYAQTLRSHGRYLPREVWVSRESFGAWINR